MGKFFVDRVTLVWGLLVAATLLSYFMGHSWRGGAAISASIILIIAAIKARMIVREFMEIRVAPAAWKIVTDGWVAACTVGIGVLYFWSR